MNKKGFTLVELLAIIVILAIIMIIAAPSMSKQIEKSEAENQNILNKKIENAAHIYAAKYYADKLINGDVITFSLKDLQEDGLINLKDNCANNINSNIVINASSEYNYDALIADDCYKK